MSIDYYAVPVRDPEQIESLVEGTAAIAVPIDAAAVHAALLELPLAGNDEQMFWRCGDLYISVDITPTSVQVVHTTGEEGSQADALLGTLLEILQALRRLGLHVWDPQQGEWLTL